MIKTERLNSKVFEAYPELARTKTKTINNFASSSPARSRSLSLSRFSVKPCRASRCKDFAGPSGAGRQTIKEDGRPGRAGRKKQNIKV
jgi:hypothetical protein